MGIKNLNSFLKENCTNSIKCIPLSELAGKKIAVDISIYLYKYVGDDTLIENMYLMLAVFRYYNIIPIFVFDGKSPTEKKELLQKRREDKLEAENEYNRLKKILDSSMNEEEEEMEESKKEELIANMDSLKKQFVYVTRNQIEQIKELIRGYGMTYYDAIGEADELCALLVIKKKVWACLSEDMDLFVYGCKRVLRYLSLLNHTIVLYDTKSMLQELDITLKDFQEICILSGTDYNINFKDDHSLQKSLKFYKKYYKTNRKMSFYEWLKGNTTYIQDEDAIINIYNMFNFTNNNYNQKVIDKISITNLAIKKEIIVPILQEDGFIFMKK